VQLSQLVDLLCGRFLWRGGWSGACDGGGAAASASFSARSAARSPCLYATAPMAASRARGRRRPSGKICSSLSMYAAGVGQIDRDRCYAECAGSAAPRCSYGRRCSRRWIDRQGGRRGSGQLDDAQDDRVPSPRVEAREDDCVSLVAQPGAAGLHRPLSEWTGREQHGSWGSTGPKVWRRVSGGRCDRRLGNAHSHRSGHPVVLAAYYAQTLYPTR
jgi:hypothetical protein